MLACGGRVTETPSADASPPTTTDAAAPTNYKIFFRYQRASVHVWHSKTGAIDDLGLAEDSTYNPPLCTYDGRFFALNRSYDTTGHVDIYDAHGNVVRSQSGDGFHAIAIRPDAQVVLLAPSANECVRSLDADGTTTSIGCFQAPDGVAAVYSPNGNTIAWNIGSTLFTTNEHGADQKIIAQSTQDDAGVWTSFPPRDVAFSFDGEKLTGTTAMFGAYLDTPGNIEVVDLATTVSTSVLEDAMMDDAHFTPDGRELVFLGSDPDNAGWLAIRRVDIVTHDITTLIAKVTFIDPQDGFCLALDSDE